MSTDLVGCREDDSRRKEKKIGGEEHMIGEEREGGRKKRSRNASGTGYGPPLTAAAGRPFAGGCGDRPPRVWWVRR